MTLNEKYNFKVSMNQFGTPVDHLWCDAEELIMINAFETAVLNLPKKNHYTMIELGANQAYYSLVFKSILGKDNTTNIMVEPYEPYFPRAKNQFELNNYEGIYINKGIGTKGLIGEINFNTPSISVDELIAQHSILDLDMLHCDIDGAEILMLEGAINSLKNKIINYAFILTHFGVDQHNKVKEIINQYEYEIVLDEPNKIIGADSLIVIKRK